MSLQYPDKITLSRKGASTGPRDEFGKQSTSASTVLYDNVAEIQDAPLSIAVQLAGDEDLKSLARVFLLEGTDIRAFQVGDDAVGTYGASGRQVSGKVLQLDPFVDSVYVKWAT